MIEVGLPIILRIMSALVLFWSALHFFGTWITFRIVNFILLIALAVYFFKTHLSQWIREQIEKKDSQQAALQNKKEKLKDQLEKIKQRTVDQEKKIEAVHAKVRQWQACFEQEKAEAEKVYAQLSEQMVARRKNQLNAFCREQQKNSVIPLVLKETGDLLERDFKNEAFGKSYLAKIIASLQEDKK